MSARESLHHDMVEMGILKIGEGSRLEFSDCELLYLYRAPFKWTTLYEEWFWDVLNPLAVGLYNFFGFIYNLFN